jgi:hypothetical protein
MQGPPAGFNPAQSLLPDVPGAQINAAMGGGGMIGGATIDFLQKLIAKIKSKEVAALSYKNKGSEVPTPVPSLSKRTPASALVPLKFHPIPVAASPSAAPVTSPSAAPVISSSAAPATAAPLVPVQVSSPTASSSAAPSVPVQGQSTTTASSAAVPASLAFNPAFFEPQDGAGCGRHALNNLLGAKYFTKATARINQNVELEDLTPPLSLNSLCEYLSVKYPATPPVFDCRKIEDYDTPVLMTALAIIHYPSERINDADLQQSPTYTYNETQPVIGYIINNGDVEDTKHIKMNHWVALRQTPGATTFELIDSMGNRPFSIFASLSDFLTKRHTPPRFRAVIKVFAKDDSLDIRPILESVGISKVVEGARADGVKAIKTTIEGQINSITQLSKPQKQQFISLLSGHVESEDQLIRLRELLERPQIHPTLPLYSGQLLELNGPTYPHFKLSLFILLLTLILQNRENTYLQNNLEPIDDITELDMIISFYYTANEAQKDTIYALLTGDQQKRTLDTIASNSGLKATVDRLMSGKLIDNSPTISRFVFDDADTRTATFLNAFLSVPQLTAADTAVQTRQPSPSPALDKTAATPLAESLSIPTAAVPVSVGECFIYTDSNPISNFGSVINAKDETFRCNKIHKSGQFITVYGGRYSKSQHTFEENSYVFAQDTFPFIQKIASCPPVASADPPAVAQPSRLTPEEYIQYLQKAAIAKINTIQRRIPRYQVSIIDTLIAAVNQSKSETDLTTFLEQCTNLAIFISTGGNTHDIFLQITKLVIGPTSLQDINTILLTLPQNLIATKSQESIRELLETTIPYPINTSNGMKWIEQNNTGDKEAEKALHINSGQPINLKHRAPPPPTLRSKLKKGSRPSTQKKSRFSSNVQVANVEKSKFVPRKKINLTSFTSKEYEQKIIGDKKSNP